MRALVVYESLYGNTQLVAEQIRRGLAETCDVTLLEVNEPVPQNLADFGLVVLGGPTHAFGMSTPESRTESAGRGRTRTYTHPERLGIREWLPNLGTGYPGVLATFDTKVGATWSPGAASKAIWRWLRRTGYRPTARRSFLVTGTRGPLRPGQLYQAHVWGNEVAVLAHLTPSSGT